MSSVSLALMWHQHQPYYPDDVGGENPMPWVRLHGTKDYIGMALHLEEVPEFRCTINLVPSLLVQIEAYVQGATDKHLRVSRLPADGLAHDDAHLPGRQLLHGLCRLDDPAPPALSRAVHPARPRSRFGRAGVAAVSRARPARPPGLVEPELDASDPVREGPRARRIQGQGAALHRRREAVAAGQAARSLAEIIPLHRKLADRGQVELTTTPFFHPILPLLFDKRLAREAMPDVNLPGYRDGYPEDAEVHVRRAVEAHVQHFGERPRGMWPSEGSVCQQMIPLLARHGIQWIATDEEILGCSTHGKVGRDSRGHVRHPELLYRPWKVAEAGHELGIVFRDHSMSDQVGFHYQRSPGPTAAYDFLGKVHAIGDACRFNSATIVPVILDGENCWEYYPDGGVSFLRSLYHGAVRDPRIKPVTVGEFLRDHPPTDTLHRLFAGSWISHNFAIWIGHPEDNRAWDGLHMTRQFLVAQTQARGPRPGAPWRGPGMSSISPRARTGSGGTATTTRARSTRCSTTCFASTCGTSTRCWNTTRPASSSRRSRKRRRSGRSTTSRTASSASRSTATRPTSSGSTQPATSAETSAEP